MAAGNGANGHSQDGSRPTLSVEANNTLPGETFAVRQDPQQQQPLSKQGEPYFSQGPVFNGRQTTLGLYEPQHLVGLPLMTPLRQMINDSYGKAEASGRTKVLPETQVRLPHENAFMDSVGRDPGTFTYIVTYADTDEVLGTASAHRYVAPVLETVEYSKAFLTFGRFKASPSHDGAELWELKVLATDPGVQKQGLATYLMQCVETETKRRFDAEQSRSSNGVQRDSKRLIMLLSSIKEINSRFYKRRGYGHDYETSHAKGVLGSETGFHVEHFSKILE